MASMIQQFEANNYSGSDAESGVDAYLNALLIPRSDVDFDVLKFWQSSASIYPVFSRMAKDILAIPITSVASESSFSKGGRVLTKYRSSLLPKNVEAFVTIQNWLFGYLKEEEVNECFEVVKDAVSDEVDLSPDR
ncbi:zinc finger BED domain-containing protein DAYSLEEPER-like [Beta vulgaris subsp. vulgaris]|uniref:zinc finger BED domain-containing protein DAYSLEEPER-like n=1 Tax=Beta vulgaris subsp. vulgaris TaxID=3555 RepID=UPI002037284F|nr:zinc finger BED domain-containing protein DAYSLEEPER-like [Beta vulgaris subsp. vulgaris]